MKRIFLACCPAEAWGPGDVVSYALCEDGTALASHLSSNESWARHDMGLTSNWKHDRYDAHCGEGGWELEWVDDVATHPGWQAALALNKAQAEGGAK